MPFNLKNLDDRRHEDLVKEAKIRIAGYTRDWTDYNESDPGIALVELFAWLTETAIFRLNQAPDQRIYLAFLNLLGIEPTPARPAEAVVALQVARGAEPRTVEACALRFVAPGDSEVPFEADASVTLIGAELAALRVDDGLGLEWIDVSAQNEKGDPYLPFGAGQKGQRALYLGLDAGSATSLVGSFPEAELQIYVGAGEEAAGESAISSTALSPSSTAPASDVTWEGKAGPGEWIRLATRSDETDGLRRTGFLRLVLPAALRPSRDAGDDRQLFWIRAVTQAPAPEPRTLHRVAINAIRARQVHTFVREPLPPGSDGTANQKRRVLHPPMLLGEGLSPMLDVREADGWKTWTLVDDLGTRRIDGEVTSEEGPLRVFRVSDDRSGIELGDGIQGMVPPAGPNNLRLTYKVGGGKTGNVPPGTLKLAGSIDGVSNVEQLGAAVGGSDEEGIAQACARAPRVIRAAERAVTAGDFEALALDVVPLLNHGRVVALNRHHPLYPGTPVTGAVTLVVIPPPDADGKFHQAPQILLDQIARGLEPRRVLTTELYVVPARLRTVTVTIEIEVDRERDVGDVESAVSKALKGFLDPVTGGRDHDGWPLGAPVRRDELYSVTLCNAHVFRIRSLEIALDGEPKPSGADVALGSPVDVVVSGRHGVTVVPRERR